MVCTKERILAMEGNELLKANCGFHDILLKDLPWMSVNQFRPWHLWVPYLWNHSCPLSSHP